MQRFKRDSIVVWSYLRIKFTFQAELKSQVWLSNSVRDLLQIDLTNCFKKFRSTQLDSLVWTSELDQIDFLNQAGLHQLSDSDQWVQNWFHLLHANLVENSLSCWGGGGAHNFTNFYLIWIFFFGQFLKTLKTYIFSYNEKALPRQPALKTKIQAQLRLNFNILHV